MKGRIAKIWRNGNFGFIDGFDGVNYFFNRVNFDRSCSLKTDWIVEFDPVIQDDGDHAGEPEAINIHKIGRGKHHPLAVDAKRIADLIISSVPDDNPDKGYRLRDLNIIYNYFCNVEDSDIYDNPRLQFKSVETGAPDITNSADKENDNE